MALFKGENRHESMSMAIGIVLLVVGLIVLFIGFYFAITIVLNPRAYLDSMTSGTSDETVTGPRAEFRFTINDFTVSFTDASEQGDSSINQWNWDFGDGNNAGGQTPPPHTYMGNFSGTVRLTVRDGNDKESSALGSVRVALGEHSSGNSQPDYSTDLSAIDMGDITRPLVELVRGVAAVAGTFFMLLIVCIVGGSVLKAGWNLIRPRPETIRVRIKPKDLQAEPVYPTTYATTPQAPMQSPQQPPPPFFPPETPPPQQQFEPPPSVQ